MTDNKSNIEQINEWLYEGSLSMEAKLWTNAIDYFEKAADLAEKIDLKKSQLNALVNLAKCHEVRLMYAKSMTVLNTALSISRRINSKSVESEILQTLAKLNLKLNEFETALEQIFKAICIYEDLDDYNKIGMAYLQIAEINLKTLNYELALENLLKAKKILANNPDQNLQTKIYRLLAEAYLENGNHNKAFYYCLKSSEKAESLELYDETRKSYLLMGRTYMEKNNFKLSLKHYNLALNAAKKVEDDLEVSNVLSKIAELYNKCNRFHDAIDTLDKAISTAIIKSANYLLADIYLSYTTAFEGLRKYQKALQNFKKYNHIQTTLQEYKIRLKTDALETKTEFARAEKQKYLAIESLKLKDQFLANISHEIRTPMHGIIGLTSNLLSDNPRENQKEELNSIYDAASRLNQMLKDLLYLSKINTGKLNINDKDFELNRYMSQLIELVNLVKKEKPVEVNYHISKNVPIILNGDPHRLLQILLNLFNNAIKFTHEGEVGLDVRLVSKVKNKLIIRFTVYDTGIGISNDNLDKIFKPFQQIDESNARAYEGSGIGLNIVQQIVNILNGTIRVESEENKGSKFHVELPFKVSEKDKIESYIEEAVVDEFQISEGSKVLIVEDNKINQLYIKRLLSKWKSIRFKVVSGGKEAIKILEDESFDLILMDLQMPRMSGFELTNYIRTETEEPTSNIPIIAITANDSPLIEEQVVKAGMNGYLFKPFNEMELINIMKLHINISKLSNENEFATGEVASSPELLKNLSKKVNGDKRYMAEFIEIFLDQYPEAVTLILHHTKENDWEQVQRVAHRIKSTINIVGLGDLYEVVRAIDKHTRTETDQETIMPLYKQFVEIGDLRVLQLNNELKRLQLAIKLEDKKKKN